MLEYTKKEDIRIIINDIKTLRQGNDRSITRDEFNEKWKKLRMEIDCSFAERPTINYVRQIIAAQDDKVSIINDQLNEELERLDQCLNILDTEVKGYDDRFTDIGK
jgi:vacuolar-type H+-ATPase subunit I/STV1